MINFRKYRESDNEISLVPSLRQKSSELNIENNTSMIVGKNNAGKTTIVRALEVLIDDKKRFTANDFNYDYLDELLSKYKEFDGTKSDLLETPKICFEIKINISDGSGDYLQNLYPFMNISDLDEKRFTIEARYESVEESKLSSDIKALMDMSISDDSLLLIEFIKVLDKSTYKLQCYSNGTKIEYKLSDLINLKVINANNISNEKSLSHAFNKIIRYKYLSDGNLSKELNDLVTNTNLNVDRTINSDFKSNVTNIINSITSWDGYDIELHSEVTENSILNNFVRYYYKDHGHLIPESQFGLGYTNLILIIAELIDFKEQSKSEEETGKSSFINLVIIEEPETFMHPQMQEVFIKNINDLLKKLLGEKGRLNAQILITTHSTYILNSKLRVDSGFDNIIYVKTDNKCSKIINLNNQVIRGSNEDGILKKLNDDEFTFLKKHIKFKYADLFFADGVILIEGNAEQNLVPIFLDKKIKEKNKDYFISLLSVSGAYAHVYFNLLNILGIPSLVITDLDIKRDKGDLSDINVLKGRKTTNKTLIRAFGDSKLDKYNSELKLLGNIAVSTQYMIENKYPTSFEEALILMNYNNITLNKCLSNTQPKNYEEIVGECFDEKTFNKNEKKLVTIHSAERLKIE